MSNKIRYIFIGLLCLFIFTVFFKGLEKSNNYTPTNISNNVESSFKAKTLYENTEVSFAELLKTNDFLLINIWASWCLPCREEHPKLIKLSKNKSIKLIGLNYRDNPKNAKKFLNEFGDPYFMIIKDSKGMISVDLAAIGVPETFIINKDKKIIKRFLGSLSEKSLNEINLITK